jgi:hypothetical protein
MMLSARVNSWQGKVTNAAPGTLCFLLAVVLGAFVLTNKLKYRPNGGIVEYFGGGGAYLSQPLRHAMADLLMCERYQGFVSDAARAQCEALYDKHFQRLPNPDDMKEIEQLEARARQQRDSDAVTRLEELAKTFRRN